MPLVAGKVNVNVAFVEGQVYRHSIGQSHLDTLLGILALYDCRHWLSPK